MQQSSLTNYEDNDYARYSVIKPPAEFFGDNQKITRLVIDSRVRDVSLFPNPNDYEVPFEDDINDVISAQLVYIDVPFVNYLINKYFNQLLVSIGGTDYTVTLMTGDYTDATLLTELQNQLDVSLGSGTITVVYVARTDSYSFSSVNPFTFKFVGQQNTLAMLLGFDRSKNYNSSGSGPYTLASSFRRNLNYNNYIIMDMDQFDVLKSIDRDLNRSFAMIPRIYDNLNLSDKPKYVKYFSPTIPRLNKLRVRFYDRYGNPYDFQNQDHRFEIEVKSFKQKRKYGSIFSQ